MKALVDTHTLIWIAADDSQLSLAAREFVASTENQIIASIASLWEIAIKQSLGKLDLDVTVHAAWDAMSDVGIEVQPIECPHVERVASLPYHHRDPFDRIIIAQALVEGWVVLSRDSQFKHYGVDVLW